MVVTMELFLQRLTEIMVWIGNYNHYFLWDVITQHLLGQTTVEVMTWISYHIPPFYVEVTTCPDFNLNESLANRC